MDSHFQKAIASILNRLKIFPSFYGKATIVFEHGKPTRIVWEDSEKL